eukprot:scaffold191796_cov18-Prasinocladus_malaysianus.AAC.1
MALRPAGGPISTAPTSGTGSTWFDGIASLPWQPKRTQWLVAWHSKRRSAYCSRCRACICPNALYSWRPAGISVHTVSSTTSPPTAGQVGCVHGRAMAGRELGASRQRE